MGSLECIAMILAGGRGERLGSLTNHIAKPAVSFGGKYKIIDFTLNNCNVSEIDNIGVLTQYQSSGLHNYIRKKSFIDLKRDIYLLPPKPEVIYRGTADAVYQNIHFIEQFNPKHILVLSGDHVYEMDYREMIESHKRNKAALTIASTPVPFHEAYRFGILSTDKDGKITSFMEKPKNPESNLASMGIYVFEWDSLKKYLIEDCSDETSSHDFGKDIIPKMLCKNAKLFTHKFDGYWKDIGTLYSLWEANMDIVHRTVSKRPMLFDDESEMIEIHRSSLLDIRNSIVTDYKKIYGKISGSVISDKVSIGDGSVITDCVIMPNTVIGRNVKLSNTIVGEGNFIMNDVEIGTDIGNGMFAENNICSMGVSLVAPYICIEEGLKFKSNSHIDIMPENDAQAYIMYNQPQRMGNPIYSAFN